MAAKKSKSDKLDKEEIAFDLFVSTDMTQEEIAELVGVAPRTIWKWKKDNNWDEARNARKVTNRNLVTKLNARLSKLLDDDTSSSDEIAKLASSIERLKDERITVSGLINSFKAFTSWLFARDPELAKKVNKLQNDFVMEQTSN
jgi:transcriptional regulator with XRE-family HTH domain